MQDVQPREQKWELFGRKKNQACACRVAALHFMAMRGPDDPLGWALSLLRARPSLDPQKLSLLERMASRRQAGFSQPLEHEQLDYSRQLQAQRYALSLLSRNLALPPALLDEIGSGVPDPTQPMLISQEVIAYLSGLRSLRYFCCSSAK